MVIFNKFVLYGLDYSQYFTVHRAQTWSMFNRKFVTLDSQKSEGILNFYVYLPKEYIPKDQHLTFLLRVLESNVSLNMSLSKDATCTKSQSVHLHACSGLTKVIALW